MRRISVWPKVATVRSVAARWSSGGDVEVLAKTANFLSCQSREAELSRITNTEEWRSEGFIEHDLIFGIISQVIKNFGILPPITQRR
jgi:hypothetical protein